MSFVFRDLLPIPNICQETPFTERLNQDAASSQLMISELDRSLPSDIFHLSSVQSSLSSHPQQMEQPHICTSELLEPSITIGSSLWSDPIVKEETLSRRSSPNRSNDEFQGTTRNRWKPNSRQLYYLEQHFRTGSFSFPFFLSSVQKDTQRLRLNYTKLFKMLVQERRVKSRYGSKIDSPVANDNQK